MGFTTKHRFITGVSLWICLLAASTVFADSSRVSSHLYSLSSRGNLQFFSRDRVFLGAINLPYTPSAYAVNEEENRVYVTGRFGVGIQIFDLVSGKEVGSIKNAGKVSSAAYDAVNHQLFLLDRTAGQIHIVDSFSNKKVGDFAVPSDALFFHFSADRELIYVATVNNAVTVISARDGSEAGRITDLEDVPLRILSDSASDRLVIQHRKSVAVYRLSQLKLFDWLRLEGHPRNIQIDDSLVYVQLSGKDEEKNIAVFDLRSLELVDWIYTGSRTGKKIQTSTFMANHGKVFFYDSATSWFSDVNEALTPSVTQSMIAQLPSGVSDAHEFGLNNKYGSGSQNTPSTAFDGSGNFYFAWMDGDGNDGSGDGIFGRRLNVNDSPSQWDTLQDDFKVTKSNDTPPGSGDQLNPTISSDTNGHFVVVWVDTSGEDNDVRYALYKTDGTLKTTAIATKKTIGHQREPSVAMCPNGNFIVAWSSTGDGDGRGTFFRRFDSSGNALDSNDIQANTYIPGNTYAIKVAANTNCDFVIAWRDNDDRPRIHVRSFHSNGNPVEGSDKEIPPMGSQHKNFNPGLGMADDGSFVVAFTENSAGGTIAALLNFDQTLKDPSGLSTPKGKNPFLATSEKHQQNATGVGMAPNGKFVIAWRDDEGKGKKIGARLFKSNGEPKGSNFGASVSKIKGPQFAPAAAMDTNGNFLITWYERKNSPGIFATYFSVN